MAGKPANKMQQLRRMEQSGKQGLRLLRGTNSNIPDGWNKGSDCEKMRVCPCCGYVDPYAWRVRSWDTDDSYSTIEEFSKMKIELCARLLNGEREVQDKYYIYRLSGKGKNFVTRRALIDYKTHGWRTPTEKYRPIKKELVQLLNRCRFL